MGVGSCEASLREPQSPLLPSWLPGQSQGLSPLSAPSGLHLSFWGPPRDPHPHPRVQGCLLHSDAPPWVRRTHLLTQ